MQSSQVTEIAATLEAERNTDSETELTLVSLHDYVSKAMTEKLAEMECEGWVDIRHRKILKCLAAELKMRKAKTSFVVAKQGSAAQKLCHEAMRLAKLGTTGTRTREIELDIPPVYTCKETGKKPSIRVSEKSRHRHWNLDHRRNTN
jgi:hypothetical protein